MVGDHDDTPDREEKIKALKCYPCDICNKKFYRRSNLKRHAAQHELGFYCHHCNDPKPHPSSAALAEHVSRFHPSDTTGGGIGPSAVFDPEWKIVKTSETHSKTFQKIRTSYDVELQHVEHVEPTFEHFDTVFTTLLGQVVPHSEATDYVSITFDSDTLDFPIPLHYTKVANLNAATLFDTFSRSLNSNQNFRLDSGLRVSVDHVRMPSGSGGGQRRKYVGEYSSFDAALKSKRSIIRIREDDDHLCFPSAVAMAIERYKCYKTSDEEHEFNLIRRAYAAKTPRGRAVERLKELARNILKAAGLTAGPCGVPEIAAIQKTLPDYQINVYNGRGGDALIYRGPKASRKLYFMLDEVKKHYHVITSLKGWYTFPYRCEECGKFYEVKFLHRCKSTCWECRRVHDRVPPERPLKYCENCDRTFSSTRCYENHRSLQGSDQVTVCDTLKKCPDCGSVDHRNHHHCGVYCSKCGSHYRPDDDTAHECYITVKSLKKLKDRKFIFYDIESMLVPLEPGSKSRLNSQHVPNMLIAYRVCEKCADAGCFGGVKGCTYCGEHRFKGVNCITEFLEFVFNGENRGATCVAHNSQAYDSLFIFRALRKEGKDVDIRCKGSKLLEISVKHTDIRFIDSLNFLLAGLAQLPTMFSLKERKKGFFPHRFNVPENQNYIGPYPDKKYYGVNELRGGVSDVTGELVGPIADFEKFYNTTKDKTFDLQEELYQYCSSDVLILRDACLKFRMDFIETTGIDPLVRHLTLSQLSMDFYRSALMKPETIGRITENSHFQQRRQSARAMQWLHYKQEQLGRKLTMKSNKGEKKIDIYYVDGYDEETKTVYEFLGDFYHGNLSTYKPEDVNTKLGRTMGQLNRSTHERLNRIKALGYKVEYIWEKDFLKDEAMQEFAKTHKIVTPLAPRDCLYGGRTNALKLKHDVKPGEKIYYDDFISLYPSILKYERFPTGHPEIVLEKFKPLDEYFGLIKCKILPPTDLYIPVLPQKGKKLVFSLCRSCGDDPQQAGCTHTDEERALIGSWCTPEVKEAVDRGYQILEIYEVWDFKNSSRYNATTREHGLFSKYVDTFFKLKLQHSGWPPGCESEAGKDAFIEKILRTEGVKLKKSEIRKNPGLRTMAKLLLNSFWGKFGQKSNMSKKKVVSSRAQLLELFTDPAIVVNSIVEQDDTDESLLVSYTNSEEFVEGGQATNVVIASFVTCWARLKLYGLISKLGTQCLYFDTDSCIYLARGDGTDYIPPRGEALGQLKSELSPGNYIVNFCSSGPKSYSYVLKNPEGGFKSKVVLKGISLTYGNSKVARYDNILEKIERYVESGDNSPSVFYETENFFYRSPNFQLFMTNLQKHFRVTYDKRLICPDFSTLPYGFRSSKRKISALKSDKALPLKKRKLR